MFIRPVRLRDLGGGRLLRSLPLADEVLAVAFRRTVSCWFPAAMIIRSTYGAFPICRVLRQAVRM
jgi:hypothetical protein